VFFNFVARKRRGQEYSGVTLAIVQVNRDDVVLFGEILDFREVCASAVGESVAGAISAGTTAGDAVGVGEREERAGSSRRGVSGSVHCSVMWLRRMTRIVCNNGPHLLQQILGGTPRAL
jgi:hypothetical protein